MVTLNAEDVEEALRADPHSAAKGLEELDDVDLMSDEAKTALLKKLLARARDQQLLTRDAEERRRSRAPSEERKRACKSPYLERQNLPCNVSTLYADKDMQLQDWQSPSAESLNPG